jgi:hypothetical protein
MWSFSSTRVLCRLSLMIGIALLAGCATALRRGPDLSPILEYGNNYAFRIMSSGGGLNQYVMLHSPDSITTGGHTGCGGQRTGKLLPVGGQIHDELKLRPRSFSRNGNEVRLDCGNMRLRVTRRSDGTLEGVASLLEFKSESHPSNECEVWDIDPNTRQRRGCLKRKMVTVTTRHWSVEVPVEIEVLQGVHDRQSLRTQTRG